MKIKNVFIDTNIYLEYFEMSSSTIDTLKKLDELIEKKEIKLILPKQVQDEYWRKNKKVMVSIMRKQIESEIPTDPKIPPPVTDLPEVRALRTKYKNVRDDFQKLLKKYDEEFVKKSEVEKLIEKIFQKAERVDEIDKIIERAHHRYLKANPPYKTHEYGDAIIWENLLANFSKEDLTLITNDGDWSDGSKGKTNVNDFLEKEWREKNGKNLYFYSSLAEFINKVTGQQTIKKEVVEEEKAPKVHYFPLTETSSSAVSDISSTVRMSSLSPITADYDDISAFNITWAKRYRCPNCQEDITLEIEKTFPGLKERSLYTITYPLIYGANLSVKIECPYCNKYFDFKDIA